MTDPILSKKTAKDEEVADSALRPKSWNDYIGQDKIKENIRIMLAAAQKRGQSPDHLLFYGNSGLGKTTLATLIATSLGKEIKTASGPGIEKAGDLAAILTNLNEGDILFLDEIHRISKTIEEYLYPAMEDYTLHLILGKGPMARTMDIKLPHFTLIGATTKPGSLSSPLRNRFGAMFQLTFYSNQDIEKIIRRSADILGVTVDQKGLIEIAKCSRFTPRIANRLLRRVRDFAEVKGSGLVTQPIAKQALSSLDIDDMGLEQGDRNILLTLINKFNGGPVGIQTLSAATQEEADTILDIYEPYLMQMGFLERTPRGRIASKKAYEHLKVKRNGSLL